MSAQWSRTILSACSRAERADQSARWELSNLRASATEVLTVPMMFAVVSRPRRRSASRWAAGPAHVAVASQISPNVSPMAALDAVVG